MKIDVVFGVIGLLLVGLSGVFGAMGFHAVAFGILVYTAFLTSAAIHLWSEDRRRRARDALAVDRYVPLYHRAMTATLDRILPWVGQRREDDDKKGLRALLAASMTYRLLDRAMLIAVVYPFLLLFLHWGIFHADGRLGTEVIFPKAEARWAGWVAVGLIFMVLLLGSYVGWPSISKKHVGLTVWHWLPAVGLSVVSYVFILLRAQLGPGAFAVGAAVSVAFTGAVSGVFFYVFANAFAGARRRNCECTGGFVGALAVAIGITFVGDGAVASSSTQAGAFTVAVLGALALAFAVPIAIDFFANRGTERLAPIAAIGAPILAVAAVAVWLDWADVSPAYRAIFLFLGVLPLVNALFDLVSCAVTIALTQRGLRGGAVAWAMLDSCVALGLFLVLGATLVSVITALEAVTQVEFLDLGGLLAQAGDWRSYWWLYAMLFSTAVPTLVHLMIAAFSLQAFARANWRDRLSAQIGRVDTGDPAASVLATAGLGTLWFLSLCLPLLVVSGAVWVMWQVGLETLATGYRDGLLWLALTIGGL